MASLNIIKLRGVLLCLLLGPGLVAAGPHGHRYLHHAKRGAIHTDVVTSSVKLFQYNGKFIPETEVCAGIDNGTFHLAKGSKEAPNCGGNFDQGTPVMTSSKQATVSLDNAVTTVTIFEPAQHATSSTSLPETAARTVVTGSEHATPNKVIATDISSAGQTTSVAMSTSAMQSLSTGAVMSGLGQNTGFIQTNPNVDVEFPNGELECSEFPSSYGALHIPWMKLGGWTGIQFAEISDGLVTGLATGVNGTACSEGQDGATTFCSYACPPGYQKSQWPATQGSSSMAVSVGGLMCNGGKLHLTNPSLSTKLCIQGTGKSSVSNMLDGTASICRTDYPGTEDETVPLETQSGNTYPLTCPDSGSYYEHLGAQTSAEYYVNNKNVPVEVACQWGQDGTDEGNWAPVVIGAETDSSGATWLSIMTSRQNDPTNYKELDFSIELVGDFGGSACFYTQRSGIGYYCSAGALADFDPTNPSCKSYNPSAGVTVPGCTVQLFSGTATYHLVETD